MAYSLDNLIKDLQKNTYTPKTEEQLRQTATNRYQSVYDQQRLGAQQATETSDLAMQQQAAALDKAYSKQMEQSAQNYRMAGSQADRNLLKRGMQRSSYGASTLGNIAISGNKAQDEIMGTKNQQLGNIEQQRTLLARQLADQLRQYSASQQSDILAYMDELESQDYDRGTQSQQYNNSLASQIYQFGQQENQFNEGIRQFNEQMTAQQKQANQSQENWLKQFEQSANQFDESMAEQIRQYNAGLSMDEKKLSMSAEQFEKNLSANQSQFQQSLALDQQKLAESIRQFETQASSESSSGSSSGGTLAHWAKLGYPSQAAYNEAKAKGWNYTQWKAAQGTGSAGTGDDSLLSKLAKEKDAQLKSVYKPFATK